MANGPATTHMSRPSICMPGGAWRSGCGCSVWRSYCAYCRVRLRARRRMAGPPALPASRASRQHRWPNPEYLLLRRRQPAVVFDSGGNQPGYSRILVQREVAKSTRACWYDRAGYGWSDPAPWRRSSADIADDLHKLLRAVGVPPPYVLVGHSFGGFRNVRVFAARNPGEVAGMVLVDSADEFPYVGPVPDSLRGPGSYIPRPLWGAGTAVLDFLTQVGVQRIIDNGVSIPPGRLSEHDARLHSLQLQAKAVDAQLREGLDLDRTVAQAAVRFIASGTFRWWS